MNHKGEIFIYNSQTRNVVVLDTYVQKQSGAIPFIVYFPLIFGALLFIEICILQF